MHVGFDLWMFLIVFDSKFRGKWSKIRKMEEKRWKINPKSQCHTNSTLRLASDNHLAALLETNYFLLLRSTNVLTLRVP